MTVTELISKLELIELDGKGTLKIAINGSTISTVMITTT